MVMFCLSVITVLFLNRDRIADAQFYREDPYTYYKGSEFKPVVEQVREVKWSRRQQAIFSPGDTVEINLQLPDIPAGKTALKIQQVRHTVTLNRKLQLEPVENRIWHVEGTTAQLLSFPVDMISTSEGEFLVWVTLFDAGGQKICGITEPLRFQKRSPVFHKVAAMMPSTAAPGKPVRIHLEIQDQYECTFADYSGTLAFSCHQEGVTLPGPHTFSPARDQGALIARGITFSRPGTYRIQLTDKASGAVFSTNPVVVTNQTKQLYWGDIHVHSGYSNDAIRSPEENYQFGRDIRGLDIMALSDHTHSLTQKKWDDLVRIADDFYQPGLFTTFAASEWHGRAGPRGFTTKNIYWRNSQDEFYCGKEAYHDRNPNSPYINTAEKLYALLEERNLDKRVMTIQHAIGTQGIAHVGKWDFIDPRYERLLEIYSAWGSSERHARYNDGYPIGHGDADDNENATAQHAWAKGWKLGVIAASDGHDGRGGRKAYHNLGLITGRGFFNPVGFMGVWADKLDRDSVFDALYNRRCYGTTGERIVVEFSVNDHPMGSEITVNEPDESRICTARVIGTNTIKNITVVRNNADIYIHAGVNEEESFTWIDSDVMQTSCYYYLRIKQADGEMAWTSPVWVTRYTK